MNSTLQFIGEIHSPLKSLDQCPLQENEQAPGAELEIFAAFSKGIRDIKPGSEILLLTWLHQADRSVVECVPRREYDSPAVGVFSTRSPDRPNPIGVHKVKVVSSDNNLIRVEALEVLDKTPIVDIKPVWNE
jgi:tRNA-Thr(GGU) m(6)t(6)A37 methyltransferase TsaA